MISVKSAWNLKKKKHINKPLFYQLQLTTPSFGKLKQKGRLVSLLNLHSLPHSFLFVVKNVHENKIFGE